MITRVQNGRRFRDDRLKPPPSNKSRALQDHPAEEPSARPAMAMSVGFMLGAVGEVLHRRVYEMTFANQVWTLYHIASEPDFSQRFTGTFSEDGNTIAGRWDTSNDGTSWTHDFDLTYTRVT